MKLEKLMDTHAAQSGIQVARLTTGAVLPGSARLIRKPESVLISTRFPGRHFYKLSQDSGSDMDETLAHILISGLDDEQMLANVTRLREIILDPKISNGVITAIYPRTWASLKRGDYFIAEEYVMAITADALAAYGTNPAINAVYGALVCRMVRILGQLSMASSTVYPVEDTTLALSVSQAKRLYFQEKLKLALSETILNAKLKDIDLSMKNTVAIIAQRFSDALLVMSHSLLEAILSLVNFDTAMHLVNLYYLKPDSLPNTLRSAPSLMALANYANFFEAALAGASYNAGVEDYEYRMALDDVYSSLSSSPAVSSIPLVSYAQHFRYIQARDSAGMIKGLIVTLPLGQTAELKIVNLTKRSEMQYELEVLHRYSPLSSLSSILNKAMLAPEAVHGLYEIMADSLVSAPVLAQYKNLEPANPAGTSEGPMLLSVGLGPKDIFYLALATAVQTALLSNDSATAGLAKQLAYAVKRHPELGVTPAAAVEDLLYFVSPAEALTFSTLEGLLEYRPLPQREQTLPSALGPTVNVRDSQDLLVNMRLQDPYQHPITLDSADGAQGLSIQFSVTGRLPNLTTANSRLGAIREPATMLETDRVARILSALVESDDRVVKARALTWAANIVRNALESPLMGQMAHQVLLQSLVGSGIDARAARPYVRKMFYHSVMAIFIGTMRRLSAFNTEISGSVYRDLPTDEVMLVLSDSLRVPDFATTVVVMDL